MKSKKVFMVLGLLAGQSLLAQDESISSPVLNSQNQQKGVITSPVITMYSNIPGHPTATIPDTGGLEFEAGTGTSHFDRIYGHPNGNWVLSAYNNQANDVDELVFANNQVIVTEGDVATWTGGELVGLIDTYLSINKTGQIVFATNTDGVTTADEYIVKYDGSVFSKVVQEGDSVGALPAANWGSTLESANISDSGEVGFVADSVANVDTLENEWIYYADAIIAREGIDVPAGQLGSETWDNFDLSDYWVTHNGQNWLAQGDLTGSTASDDVVVLNGQVVVQEGVILNGSAFAEAVDGSGIVGVHLAPNGDYYVRGNNDATEIDWVYSNGAVITSIGDAITQGVSELWSDVDYSDCFFLHVGNSYGDYVIGGVTDADSSANGVLVKNNQTVVVRESDPIDLDNNGIFDDNAFFDTFGNDDAVLFDNGDLMFVATIKNAVGTRIGQGVFMIATDSDLIFRHNYEY